MKYLAIPLTDGSAYAQRIPDSASDKPLFTQDKVILDLVKQLENLQERLDKYEGEWKDVEDCKIMEMLELSDIYGALEAMAVEYNLTMNDLKIMSNITKRIVMSVIQWLGTPVGKTYLKETFSDIDNKCPKCGSDMLEREDYFACSECEYYIDK